jgi:hypothetical protein
VVVQTDLAAVGAAAVGTDTCCLRNASAEQSAPDSATLANAQGAKMRTNKKIKET